MDFMLKLEIVCILILASSKSGLSQQYPPRFDPFPSLLQLNEGCSNRTLANITARGSNGVITIFADDDATRAKVNIVQIEHTLDRHYTSTTVQIQQRACMDREGSLYFDDRCEPRRRVEERALSCNGYLEQNMPLMISCLIGTNTFSELAIDDARTEPTWYLYLFAEDTSGLKAVEPLQIYILDVNDEKPSFPSKLYQITVSENESVSTEVLKVVATDPDNGVGGVVRYSLLVSTWFLF